MMVLGIAGSVGYAARGVARRTYVVRRGDTVSGIASRSGVSVRALVTANDLPDADHVVAGEVLVIPSRRSSGGGPVGRAAPKSGPLAAVPTPPAGRPSFPAALRDHPGRLALLPSFRHWAAVSGVPAGLLEATAWMESGWQPTVVSSTGAVGVGQIEPATVRFICRDLLHLRVRLDPRRPDANIEMSATYLAWLLRQTGGSVANALGSYYQGIDSLSARGPWMDTRAYVADIGRIWQQFRSG